jgi:hypothetical protein
MGWFSQHNVVVSQQKIVGGGYLQQNDLWVKISNSIRLKGMVYALRKNHFTILLYYYPVNSGLLRGIKQTFPFIQLSWPIK